jgi:hypothetical protein
LVLPVADERAGSEALKSASAARIVARARLVR